MMIPSIFLATLLFSSIFNTANAADSSPNVYEVTIMVNNTAPAAGSCLTPVWVGLHDGGFDVFNRGDPASAALERIAEDGTVSPLSELFNSDPSALSDSVASAAPFCPGFIESTSFLVLLPSNSSITTYLSFTTMVLPSNDAFIANGNPRAYPMFQGTEFIFQEFIVNGTRVYDAGTEVNDEIPQNTAFFGQMMPDTGVVENGVVTLHPGFNPVGSGGILDDEDFMGADFTAPGYDVAKFMASAKPVSSVAFAFMRGRYVLPAPGVATISRGFAKFFLTTSGEIGFYILVKNVHGLRSLALSTGGRGDMGTPVVTLFQLSQMTSPMRKTANKNNFRFGQAFRPQNRNYIFRGLIESDEVIGEMPMTLLQLWKKMIDGEAFIQLTTNQHPNGLIRGNFQDFTY